MSNLNGAPGAVISVGVTPAPPPPPPVTSVFGRIGAVVAVAGDYDSDQVDNVSTVAGATVSDALDTLDGEITAVEGDVATLQTDVSTLQTDVSTLENRQIIAGDGLDGGGNLTADVTLNVVANADGSIIVNADDIQVGILATDAQHGDRGGGTLHDEATTLAAGFMSSADKTFIESLKVASAAVSATTNVYVATTGNDANDGSIATPKLTLAGAYALLPQFLTGPFVVHFATGTYDHESAPQHFQTSEKAFIALIGDGAGQPGDDGFTETLNGTADVGSSLGTFVTTGGLVASDLIGQTIEITSGAATGCRRLINENTTTDIILDYPLVNAATGVAVSATAGNTFRVVRPAVILDGTANLDTLSITPLVDERIVHHVQLRLQGTNGFITGGSRLVCFFGCEFDIPLYLATPTSFGQTATVNTGVLASSRPSNDISWETERAVYDAVGGSQAHNKWEGWGISDPTGSANTIIEVLLAGTAVGYYVAALGFARTVSSTGSIIVKGGRFQSATPFSGGGTVLFDGLTQTPIMLVASTMTALAVSGTGSIRIASTTTVDQSGNLPAISLSSHGRLSHGVALTITHTATTQACIVMSDNSCWVGSQLTTITTDYFSANLSGTSKIEWRGATIVQADRFTMSGQSKVDVHSTNFSLTGGTGAAITMSDQAALSVEITATIDADASGSTSGVINMEGTSMATFRGACTITNNNVGADSNGVIAKGGARLRFTDNPSITIASAAGYGMNLRGGGQAFFNAAPSGVVGVTADFTVGNAGGEDFPDTDLAAALSFKSNGGGSFAQRS